MKIINALLKSSILWTGVAAIVLLQLAAGAHAADAPRYAVLSLIGDRLLMVQRVPATETQPERSLIEFLDLDAKVFDQTAVLAVNVALKRSNPSAQPILLEARDASLYSAQAALLEQGGSEPLRKLLAGTKATHLILITRLRYEAMLRTDSGHLGSGPLEGLGFYLDRTRQLIRDDTGQQALGFLGPFAYFQVSVFDLARRQVIRQEQVVASRTLSAARSPQGDPWTALTAQDKVRVLQQMLRSEIARVMPPLVRSAF